jgi:hypothetical protein
MAAAFAAIDAWEANSNGAYIRPRIHLMRAQAYAHLFPVDSADSTNLAVNHNRQRRVAGEDLAQFAARLDGRIQASAGAEAEHQVKQPLLAHVEAARWQADFFLELELRRLGLERDADELAEARWAETLAGLADERARVAAARARAAAPAELAIAA